MSMLLDALQWAGESLDKPGAALRGLLAGRPDQLANLIPFSDTFGITDPSQRVSGRGLLEQYGMLSPKSEGEGFGLGDIAGMGVEMALDPTNLVGAGALKKLIGVRRAALASNANRDMLLAKGAMPEEVAKLTKAVDNFGSPVATYHGTPHVFDQYDLSKMNPESLYGPGVYTTVAPDIASEYVDKGAKDIIDHAKLLEASDVVHKKAEAARRSLEKGLGQYAMIAPAGKEHLQARLDRLAHLDYIFEDVGRVAKDPGYRQEILQSYPELSKIFDATITPAPRNVRKQFLDIRNPFDIEKTFTSDEASRMGKLLTGDPSVDFRAGYEGVQGQQIYDSLVRAVEDIGEEGTQLLPDLADRVTNLYPKAGANELLKQLGFDAITHTGGGRMGGGNLMHQVYMALDPRQIYQPLVVGGPQHVPSTSPLLAAMLGQNVLARAY